MISPNALPLSDEATKLRNLKEGSIELEERERGSEGRIERSPFFGEPCSSGIGGGEDARAGARDRNDHANSVDDLRAGLADKLRPYQADALTALRQTIGQGVRRVMLQAPTGSGKTLLTCAVIDGALRKGNRVAFVVPYLSLIDQAVSMFWAEGIRDVGVIQGEHAMTDWSKPVQVCSIQTILRRDAYPKASLVVIDEAHLLYQAHRAWLGHADWQRVPFIGLSATPFTKGLGKHFETLLIAATMRGLIDQGYLSKYRVFASGHPDLSGVKIVAGDYHEGQLGECMQGGTLTADIVDTWLKLWGKDKTLAFAVNRAHAKQIQARFENAGVPCGYQDANTSAQERADIRKKFHSGEHRVLVNVDTLSVGVDFDVRCLVLARPTRSEAKYVQIVGRALRTADGKDDALILDHSDTTQRLGFVADIHHEHLDDGKPKKGAAARKPPVPKPCPQCAMLRPPRVLKCENCGFKVARECKVIERDGQLVEIRPGERPPASVFHGKPANASREEKQQWFSMLRAIGHRRAYRDGWAANQFRERYGHWPDGFRKEAAEPTEQVERWVKGRMIRYAKGRAAGAQAAG